MNIFQKIAGILFVLPIGLLCTAFLIWSTAETVIWLMEAFR